MDLRTLMSNNDQPSAAEISQEQLDKIVDRARKILEVTKEGSGATEEEIDTAMRRVQEMMAKYNLDLATIAASSAGKEAPDSTQRIKDEETEGKTRFHWQRDLARYVAEAYFCHHLIARKKIGGYWRRRGSQEPLPGGRFDVRPDAKDSDIWVERKWVNQHIFVGRKGNVVTAKMMYAFLTQQVENLTPIEDNKDRLSNFAMSFKAGCAERLCERLAQRRQDLIDNHDAKVKAEQAAVVAEFERKRAEKAARKALQPHAPSEAKAAFEQVTAGAYDARRPIGEVRDHVHPPVDPEGPWTPAGATPDEEADEPEPGAALVLMSMYDEQETDANIEFMRGLAPGTLARRRAEEREWERQYEEREAKRRAEAEVEEIERPVRDETDRERKARERREAREYEANRRRWAREDAAESRRMMKEYYKHNRAAFAMGSKAGNKIGLDTQAGAGKKAKALR